MSKRALEFVLALFCFVISIIPIVFTAVSLLLCTIYTKFLSIYLSRKHKTKIELLNGIDGLFSERKIESLINSVFVFEGETDIERIKESVRVRWTDVRENGVYTHPKLRCSIAMASGYYYWLPEHNFSLDDHVKVYECAPPDNDAQFYDVLENIGNSPIPDDISPWMVYVFTLGKDCGRFAGKPHFGIIFRIHHSICDGLSCVMMTGNCLLEETTVKTLNLKKTPKVSILETISKYLTAFFYIPLFVGWLTFQRSNVLHAPEQIGDRILRVSSSIPLDRIKRVGKLTQTTVSEVMTAVVTRVLGRYYEKIGYKPLKPVFANVPISLRTSTKKEFSNKVGAFVVKLPVDRNYGFLELLTKIKEAIYEQKKSFLYLSGHLMTKWTVNRFPSSFVKVIKTLNNTTVLISNIAGYQSRCYSRFGDELKFYTNFPPQVLKLNLCFSILSYNGDINITMSADKSIVDDVKSVELFLEMCIEEFESFEQSIVC